MPAIYNLHQLSKVQPTYQTGQICSCSRHIAFYPFTTLNKFHEKKKKKGWGGRRNLPTICRLQLWHVLCPSGRIFPLARESSPIPELPTYFQTKNDKHKSCERGVCCCTYTEQPGKFSFLHTCDLASSSYIFLLSSSFCFPAEQLRQF